MINNSCRQVMINWFLNQMLHEKRRNLVHTSNSVLFVKWQWIQPNFLFNNFKNIKHCHWRIICMETENLLNSWLNGITFPKFLDKHLIVALLTKLNPLFFCLGLFKTLHFLRIPSTVVLRSSTQFKSAIVVLQKTSHG